MVVTRLRVAWLCWPTSLRNVGKHNPTTLHHISEDLNVQTSPVTLQHTCPTHDTQSLHLRAVSDTEAENDTTRCLAAKWGEARRKVLVVAFKASPLWRPRKINGPYG
jgi:hypothetical protein